MANARQKLAERGVEPQQNLQAAIKLYKTAQEIFPDGSTNYARTTMNEANARQGLAERGVEPQQNLQEAKDLYVLSISIVEKLRDCRIYSLALLNFNRFLTTLFLKIGDKRYLLEAKQLLEDAEVKIQNRKVEDINLILAKLHENRAGLLEFEGKTGINEAAREYEQAYNLINNPFYKFMDEFCRARIDLEENAFCRIVDTWETTEKEGIFLDYYDYAKFECHIERAISSEGISRNREFRYARERLERIKERTPIKVIQDRASAYVYLLNALVKSFRKDRFNEAKSDIQEACSIFEMYDDMDGKKTCDVFYNTLVKNKDPNAYLEIIKDKHKLSCPFYRLLKEGAERKLNEVGVQSIKEGLDDLSRTTTVGFTEINRGLEHIKSKIEQGFQGEAEHFQLISKRLDGIQSGLNELNSISNTIEGKEGEKIREFSKYIQESLEHEDDEVLKRFIEAFLQNESTLREEIQQAPISEKEKKEAEDTLDTSLKGLKGIIEKVKNEMKIFGRNVTYNLTAALIAEGIIKNIIPVVSTALLGIPIPSQIMDIFLKATLKK